MTRLDVLLLAFRPRSGRHLPLWVFLLFLVATVVIGNVILVLNEAGFISLPVLTSTDPTQLQHFNTPGFWLLLVMPLVLVPAFAYASERALATAAGALDIRWSRVARQALAEIRPGIYVAVCLGLHAFCLVIIQQQGVVPLLATAADGGPIDVRFAILERVGFPFRVAVNSLLPFLVVYALIKTLRVGGRFWPCCYLVNFLLTSFYLVVLHMKWPVLVLWLVNVFAIYAFGRKHVAATVVAAAILLVVGYLGVAAFVLHQVQVSRHGAGRPPESAVSIWAPGTVARPTGLAHGIATHLTRGIENAHRLLLYGVLRMAVAYPYYFEEFTQRGSVCGTVWDRVLRRPSPCAPSTYIFRIMAVRSTLGERGTAPAAVSISGYALGGWPAAVFVTVLTGLLLGAFGALGRLRDAGGVPATIWLMGAQVAYFLTQLPFEGPLVYDHGALWWGTVIVVPVAAAQLLARRLGWARKPAASSPPIV